PCFIESRMLLAFQYLLPSTVASYVLIWWKRVMTTIEDIFEEELVKLDDDHPQQVLVEPGSSISICL
ncbi:hypothetical protein Tco_0092804, partial [Tanacetum coccineum]